MPWNGAEIRLLACGPESGTWTRSFPASAEIDRLVRRCRVPTLLKVAAAVVVILLSQSCAGSGVTAPTGTSLADQMEGTFQGQFQNPSLPTAISDYQIVVAKVDDTSVRVSPASGSIATTFLANLESQVSGGVTSIALQAPGDILENNGTFVAATGRLSYSYHLGGSASANIEVFSGTKQ